MKYFRNITIYFVVFSFGLIIFGGIFIFSKTPEKTISGQWEELKWEYEKVNRLEDSLKINTLASDQLKEIIGKQLIIHEAEKWEFLPGGELKLSDGESSKSVNWRIKGRGHILKIKHNNDTIEYYNITELDEDLMVLNFESDIHARGIAKLTFKKIRNL